MAVTGGLMFENMHYYHNPSGNSIAINPNQRFQLKARAKIISRFRRSDLGQSRAGCGRHTQQRQKRSDLHPIAFWGSIIGHLDCFLSIGAEQIR
jgi:hypothetical protein